MSAHTAATRTETDSFGPLEVPADKYWGAQTQRSIINFPIGWERQPVAIIRALGVIKKACALVNVAQGDLDAEQARKTMMAIFYRYANIKVFAVGHQTRIDPASKLTGFTDAQVLVTGAHGGLGRFAVEKRGAFTHRRAALGAQPHAQTLWPLGQFVQDAREVFRREVEP